MFQGVYIGTGQNFLDIQYSAGQSVYCQLQEDEKRRGTVLTRFRELIGNWDKVKTGSLTGHGCGSDLSGPGTASVID